MAKKKNYGENDKKVEAKQRKDTQRKEQVEKISQLKEDQYWEAQGEGQKSKAQQKKEEKDMKLQEVAKRKQENKKIAEVEQQELAASKNQSNPKVTRYELDQIKQEQQQLREKRLMELQKQQKREVDEDTYEQMIGVANYNRVNNDVARPTVSTVEEAISVLKVDDGPTIDSHPEKRLKAAFAEYEERELEMLKKEKPGLKLSQYKEYIWKAWLKSPQNPVNVAKKQKQQQNNESK